MAGQNMDQFEAYFRRADLDQDGRITGAEAVAFFQGSNLPKQVLAQIWTHADQNRTGFLGRHEFYNALKLVTVAQSKRQLTPDLVKAALYGPASSRIPAPQINFAAIAVPQTNLSAGMPVSQLSGATPAGSQNMGIREAHGFSSQQTPSMRPPRPPPPTTVLHSQQGVAGRGMPGAGTMGAPRSSSSNVTADHFGGRTSNSTAGVTSQVPYRGISPSTSQGGFGLTASGSTSSVQPGPQATSGLTQPAAPKQNDLTPLPSQVTKDVETLNVSRNGFASDSMFGDVFSATSMQQKQDSSVTPSSSGVLPVSSAIVSSSDGPQPTVKPSPLAQPSASSQHQQVLPSVKNQQVSVQSSAAFPVGAGNTASLQPQKPWPRMNMSDVQKYNGVFLQVDTDRDGKITGEQARNLFLSWRLPREVLKQVWDLSDQDNDSMLSLREFCIALYLMERYREGRPLPSVLPSGIMFDETLLPPASGQLAAYGNAAWRPSTGWQQTQGMSGARPPVPASGGRPPRPAPTPQPDEAVQPSKPKPKVPVLEKHLIDQLSTEEQNLLNSKFQEATQADKKVEQLEKEILESKEKIEFYRSKMQELVLYKSRCDSRLNEITERVSADKREAESLAKKYEDKYKQTGDVASKLTIEEATFRDIQEKKMELYRAIIKMEQDGNADSMQERANHIQLDLEDQVKSLNERCKTYGLRAKPTSLVELPFGWQPGIQEGTADWDEDWDKFEDEGFTFVKELTLDVKNVITPPKPKSSLVVHEMASAKDSEKAVLSSNGDAKSDKLPSSGERIFESEAVDAYTQSEERIVKSPTDSPSRKNELESPSKKFQESQSKKDFREDVSPHTAETQSVHGGAESVLSGDRNLDDSGWGTSFDTHYDADSLWDTKPKDMDRERHGESSFFGSDSWGLNPIKTGTTRNDNMLPKATFTFDSVPSTPIHYDGSPQTGDAFNRKSPFGFADSVPGTPVQKNTFGFVDSVPSTPVQKSTFGFVDSVPSTPLQRSSFGFADSVPSTPMQRSSFGFADSVPSTPMKFGERPEDHSFDSFSRFDSFNMHDGGAFPSRETFTRFDSFRSTADSEYDHGLFPPQESMTRFDSIRSNRDSEYGQGFFPPHETFTRFDSFRSTTQDSDFGHESFTPRESLARFDSTKDADYGHGFPSFDDTDPFVSSDLFKTSFETQTPRRESDNWKSF